MEGAEQEQFARRTPLVLIRPVSRPGILLADGNLGRRATLRAALALRYIVETAATPSDALVCAGRRFDLAVLDAATLGASMPAVIRQLRRKAPHVRLIVVAAYRDVRAQRHAARLSVDAIVGGRARTKTLFDRIDALAAGRAPARSVNAIVGRAIDLIAHDVTHLLDVAPLAAMSGASAKGLDESFRAGTGLGVRDYVTAVRDAVAEQLLRDTGLSVETLVDLLGFSSVDDLARAFRGPAGDLAAGTPTGSGPAPH
jgi:AraC-like DNA-binding protein